MNAMSRILLILSFAMSCVLASVELASAQVPPHTPGTICFTPQFWCWAPVPGPPGAPCACPVPNGSVQGQLG